MRNENRKYFIPTIIATALMFVWIFVTVALTGGREISDFTDTDKKIFTVFMVLELLTVASIVIFIIKAQKLVNKNDNTIQNNIKMPIDKRQTT